MDHTSRSVTSRTKFSFHFVPLGFIFEHVVSSDENETKSKPSISRRTGRETTLVEVRVPLWFANTQYSISLRRVLSGWMIHPRVYKHLDNMSPFIKACSEGDVEKLQLILSSNTATPYDRYDGLTGLDVGSHFPVFNSTKLTMC